MLEWKGRIRNIVIRAFARRGAHRKDANYRQLFKRRIDSKTPMSAGAIGRLPCATPHSPMIEATA
jgi:hypothetical protein